MEPSGIDISENAIDYNILQAIHLLRNDCIEMHLSEMHIVNVLYNHVCTIFDLSRNHVVENILTYYELENIDAYQDVERYLTTMLNDTSTTNEIQQDSSPDVEDDDFGDIFDQVDDIIIENGQGNIRFTRMVVNSLRFVSGTSPPSHSSSPITRNNRFEDVKVILRKNELDKHEACKYNTLDDETRATNNKCTICLDDFTEQTSVRKMDCNHVFHKKCIDKWLLEYNYKCPMCRKECGSYEPKL